MPVCMNKRRTRVFRSGTGIVAVIPKDWAEGMDVEPGDELIMLYNGKITLQKPEDPDASE